MEKMRSKLIVLFAVLSMLCSTVYTTAKMIEADAQKAPMPIVSLEFDALRTMKLLPEEFLNMSSDTTVSRAQFVGGLYKLANMAPQSDGETLPFIDVNANTPNKDAIAYFYNMGIISGTGDKTFSPNGEITYAQALKITIDFLGYKDYTAARYGEYPVAYITMAQRIALTKNLNITAFDKVLTATEAVKLLYNCGMTGLPEPYVFQEDGLVSYQIDKNKYLLSVYSNIYYAEGVVQDNGIVSLLGYTSVVGVVKIDGKKYENSNMDFLGYIGQKVRFFYKSDDEINTVLWVVSDANNKAITINSEELLPNDADYSRTKIVYLENDQRKTAKIDDYAYVIYNNTLANNYSLEQMKPRSGSIKLIDNNGDGNYDVVVVNEFKNLLVSTVSVYRNRIADKYGNTLMLDDYDTVKIIKNDKVIGLNEISNNCIVSYIESLDKKYLYLYINDVGKTEVLDELVNDGDEIYYLFAGKKYRMANSLKMLILDGKYAIPKINVGNKYTYFLDMSENIAGIVSVDDGKPQYAYLIDCEVDNKPFINNGNIRLKFLLKDGSTAIISTENKIKIDNTTGMKGTDLLNRVSVGGKIKPQVVKITLAEDGGLKEIEFAQPVISEYGYDKEQFTIDYEAPRAYYSSYVFDSRYAINANTVCFITYTHSSGETEYLVASYSSIYGNRLYYGIAVYDCNESREAAAIVLEMKLGDYSTTYHILVDKVNKVINKDGEICTKIQGISLGKKVEYTVANEELLPAGLRSGDVILIGEFLGEVRSVRLKLRLSNKELSFIDTSSAIGESKEQTEIFGYLYSNSGGNIVLLNTDGWKNGGKLIVSSTVGSTNLQISAYDYRSDKVFLGNLNELYQINVPDGNGELVITEGSTRVFILRRNLLAYEIIVVYY